MLRVTDTLSLSQVDDRPSCITHTHTHMHILLVRMECVSGHTSPTMSPRELYYVTLAGAHDMPINGLRLLLLLILEAAGVVTVDDGFGMVGFFLGGWVR